MSIISVNWEAEMEESRFEASLGKKLSIPYLKKEGSQVCNPSREGGINRKIEF
jgi:hypothetical protein